MLCCSEPSVRAARGTDASRSDKYAICPCKFLSSPLLPHLLYLPVVAFVIKCTSLDRKFEKTVYAFFFCWPPVSYLINRQHAGSRAWREIPEIAWKYIGIFLKRNWTERPVRVAWSKGQDFRSHRSTNYRKSPEHKKNIWKRYHYIHVFIYVKHTMTVSFSRLRCWNLYVIYYFCRESFRVRSIYI